MNAISGATYVMRITLGAKCREMPAKYGADFNRLVQSMLTYDKTKRPSAAEVLQQAELL